MLDDSMLDGVSELIQPSFTIVQILADVGIELVGSAGNNHVIFRPSDYGWEFFRCFLLTAEADFHVTASIVNHHWRFQERIQIH